MAEPNPYHYIHHPPKFQLKSRIFIQQMCVSSGSSTNLCRLSTELISGGAALNSPESLPVVLLFYCFPSDFLYIRARLAHKNLWEKKLRMKMNWFYVYGLTSSRLD